MHPAIKEKVVEDIIRGADSFEDALDALNINLDICLGEPVGLPCYFCNLIGAEEVRYLDEAELVLSLAYRFVARGQAVIMVSVNNLEESHDIWLSLALKKDAVVNIIKRTDPNRFVYTILFSANRYKHLGQ